MLVLVSHGIAGLVNPNFGVLCIAFNSIDVHCFLQLKERLHWASLAMGPLVSVIPGGEPVRQQVDRIIHQLEALNPCDQPLKTLSPGGELGPREGAVPRFWQDGGALGRVQEGVVEPALEGHWRLMYASNDNLEVSGGGGKGGRGGRWGRKGGGEGGGWEGCWERETGGLGPAGGKETLGEGEGI